MRQDRGEMSGEMSMRGKICLITGATSGIGLVTARELAARGATVAMVGRSETKARVAVEAIRQQTGNSEVDYLLADLSSQDAVRGVAKAFQRRYGALHVLVNDAGVMLWRRETAANGLEMTFAVNHLAPFLLTNLLLDTLRASAPARVVTVASVAHNGAVISFDDLQHKQGRYQWLKVYGQTKLANIMFTYALARRLSGSGVTANALHPGIVATRIYRSGNGLFNSMTKAVMPIFALSPEKGAETLIYLASSPEVATVSGQYFYKCKPMRSSQASYDEAAQERLWRVSEQLTGLA
ncbi:MAG TPA: SDR family oxidoreductase [Ktedonobacterales bacterium]|nr:SDR family oxidoreductase [Ktedonobacterales bacterium]